MGCIGTVGTVVWALIVLAFNLANLVRMLVFNLGSSTSKLVFRLVTFPLRIATNKKGRDEDATIAIEDMGGTPGEPQAEETRQEGQD